MGNRKSYSNPNQKKNTAMVVVAVVALGVTTFAVLRGQGFFSGAFRPNVVGQVVQTCEVTADGASGLTVPAVLNSSDYRLLYGDVTLTSGDVVHSAIGKVKKKSDLCAGATLYKVSDYGTSSAFHYAELSAVYGRKITASSVLPAPLVDGPMAGQSSPDNHTPENQLGLIMASAYKWKFDRTSKSKWPALYAGIMARLHKKASIVLGTDSFGSIMPNPDVISHYQKDAIAFGTIDRYLTSLRATYEGYQGRILADGVRPLVPPAPRETRIEPIITRVVRSRNNTPYAILFFYSYTADSDKPQYIGIATATNLSKPVFKRTTNVLSIDSPVANIMDIRYSVTITRQKRSASLILIGSAYDGTGGVKYAKFSQTQLNATKIPLKYWESPINYRLAMLSGISYCNYSTKLKICSWTTNPDKATAMLESTKEMFIEYRSTNNVAAFAKEGVLYARNAVGKNIFGNWAVPVTVASETGVDVAYTGMQRIFGSLQLPKLAVTFKFLGGKEVSGVPKVYLNTVQINDPAPTPTADPSGAVADPVAEEEMTTTETQEPTTVVDTVAPLDIEEPVVVL